MSNPPIHRLVRHIEERRGRLLKSRKSQGQPHPPAPSPTSQGGGAAAAKASRWREQYWLQLTVAVTVLLLYVAVAPQAQDGGASDTDVIKVAERMYCPVCENIPLDECQTTACLEWKDEIAAQLSAGRTPQQVIDSFVARFGDHVVGVPQDPLIRALTFMLPALATVLALAIGLYTFRRFAGWKRLSLEQEAKAGGDASDASYRQRLEKNVRALR